MTTLASSVEAERVEIDQLDVESRAWLEGLRATGAGRDPALERLHDLLLRAAHSEANRRRHLYPEIGGAELEDVCRQAADDAVVAVTAQARRLPRRQPLHDLGLRVRRLRDLGEAAAACLARPHDPDRRR